MCLQTSIAKTSLYLDQNFTRPPQRAPDHDDDDEDDDEDDEDDDMRMRMRTYLIFVTGTTSSAGVKKS